MKHFAKWLFKYTHKHEIDMVMWWSKYHKELSTEPLDYHEGVFRGVNAICKIFK